MGEFKDFYHADLGRIVRDLETELQEYPDWERILRKADDLIALAIAALGHRKKRARKPSIVES